MNFLKDIATAVKLTAEVRKAREAGQAVEVRPAVPLVTYNPSYRNTIEGSLRDDLGRDADCNVKWVFDHLPYEDRRRLERYPVNSGWVDRARFWQQCLRPALPPRMYHRVMMQFTSWYAHCQRLATGVTV